MNKYTKITNTVDLPVAFNPKTAFPLDARSMFGSLAEAENAAATAKNASSSESVYYFGQTLTVFENNVAKSYLIQGDGSLKELGGDLGSIEFTDDGVGNVNISVSGRALNFIDDGNGNIILEVK